MMNKFSENTEVMICPPFIKLEQFLKYTGAVGTGGQGKNVILDGLVTVDGEVCIMRGKKLRGGEIVRYDNKEYKCVVNDS
jgi:ribosome-associated protein